MHMYVYVCIVSIQTLTLKAYKYKIPYLRINVLSCWLFHFFIFLLKLWKLLGSWFSVTLIVEEYAEIQVHRRVFAAREMQQQQQQYARSHWLVWKLRRQFLGRTVTFLCYSSIAHVNHGCLSQYEQSMWNNIQ